MANCLLENTHVATDTLARIGGEEFAVILTNTGIEAGKKVAQKLCNRVVELNIPHVQSSIKQMVSVSIGVCAIQPAVDNSPEDLIARADDALYQAKKQGRNRVVVWTAE